MLADISGLPRRGSLTVLVLGTAFAFATPAAQASGSHGTVGTVRSDHRVHVEVLSLPDLPFRRLTVQMSRKGSPWQRGGRVEVGERTTIALPTGRWRFRTAARTSNGVTWRSNIAVARLATRTSATVRLTVHPKGTEVTTHVQPPGGRLGELFTAVNVARSTPRYCGSRWMPAVPPVRYDPALARAADAHASDMAHRNYFSHKSPEGEDFVSRIRNSGYQGDAGGENLAMGLPDATSVVAGWLDSPGHCENLMERAWTDMGLGYAQAHYPGYTSLFTYWVQEFGQRR